MSFGAGEFGEADFPPLAGDDCFRIPPPGLLEPGEDMIFGGFFIYVDLFM